MFIAKSKYIEVLGMARFYADAFFELQEKWNNLADRINRKGGEDFLSSEIPSEMRLTEDEVTTLISLCHPDKHQGKESANKLTRRLLEVRDHLRENSSKP